MAALYMNDDRLWNKCYAKLCSELEEQILADGAHYERSPMYHSIILYRLILLYQVLIKAIRRLRSYKVLYSEDGNLVVYNLFA